MGAIAAYTSPLASFTSPQLASVPIDVADMSTNIAIGETIICLGNSLLQLAAFKQFSISWLEFLCHHQSRSDDFSRLPDISATKVATTNLSVFVRMFLVLIHILTEKYDESKYY